MNFKTKLLIVLLSNLGIIFSNLVDSYTGSYEEQMSENEDMSIRKDVPLLNPNCGFVLNNNIFRLINLLSSVGLTANQQDALDTWLAIYAEMKCFDQSTGVNGNCTQVYNRIFSLISTLQSSGLPANQQLALDYWLFVYNQMKCFNQSSIDCSNVLNNNIFFLTQLMETTTGLSVNQQAALDYWTELYALMKCAGCGCETGCTDVCPL